MGKELIDFSKSQSEIENQIVELVRLGETEYLDYKSKWHECNAELVHDILCLANARSENDRYVVFGVKDHEKADNPYDYIVGVPEGDLSKKQQSVVDILDKSCMNKNLSPYIHLYKHELLRPSRILCNENENFKKFLLILHIENVPLKPFFLTQDYEGKKKGENGEETIQLDAYKIYTRHRDTNTSKTTLKDSVSKKSNRKQRKSYADDSEMELMWRERFGIDKTPKEKALMYLRNYDIWKSSDYQDFVYCVQDPDFKIKKDNERCFDDAQTIIKYFGDYLGCFRFEMMHPQNIHGEAYFLEYKGVRFDICCLGMVVDNGKRIFPYPNNDACIRLMQSELDMCQILQRKIFFPSSTEYDGNSVVNYDVMETLKQTSFEIKYAREDNIL